MKAKKKKSPLYGDGTVAEYVAALKSSPRFGPQVVHHEMVAAREADFSEVVKPWPAELGAALVSSGIQQLYTHQAEALDSIRQGSNVVISTPTASGKSLVYNLPVFERIIVNPRTKALYLFPLKALAQDQLRAAEEFAEGLPPELRPTAAICDGDTSAWRRKKLREKPPHILISNPDMLHLSLLAYHENWAPFWADLAFVILDEAHTYRGVFGSHMAWVLRRLRRICGFYGAAPQFVLSSATIGNPAELARNLLGMETSCINSSGAPQGQRHFIFLDPLDSAAYSASQLLEAALKRGLRTIVYTQSRKMTELVALWTRARLGTLAPKLSAYRAGFLPEERREIEAKLTSGELFGVVATSALELGIDIGALDVCILVGYPGTIMQTLQRSGRVGRKCRDSLTVLVGGEDALDQYFLRHPREFFKREVERAVLNPENPVIMERHLLCAAAERPLVQEEDLLSCRGVRECVEKMAASGNLLLGADGRQWFTNRQYPHRDVELRGSGRSFCIRNVENDEALGFIDGVRILKECHPGAIYLHRGQTWLIVDLNLEQHIIMAVQKSVNYFTRTLGNKETEILATEATAGRQNFRVSWGRLKVTDTVTGFQKRAVAGQQLLATEKLALPPVVFETEGLWLEIPEPLRRALEGAQAHFMGGIHALEHGAIGIFPLVVFCDRNDVGGIAYPCHPQLGCAAVFIYDGFPGGVGLSRRAFEEIEDLLRLTRDMITSCGCESGCPSCVHSPKCGSGNRPIDKAAALAILQGLLQEKSAAEQGHDKQPAAAVPTPIVPPGFTALPARPSASSGVIPERYGVFDLETKYSAAEVGGWHRAAEMGISVGVLYDAAQDQYLTFLEDQIGELVEHLKKFELVIGFNNKRFDNLVLSAYTDFDLASLPTLDLLQTVKDRLGYRLSLDHLAEHTLGVKKSATGLLALEWYKKGEIAKIIDYCRQDVEITRDLFLFGLKNSHLLFRNKAGMTVRCPVRFDLAAGKGRG